MSGKKYTILAVDDEFYNLESLRRSFHRDYNVIVTTSPKEALDIYRQEKIDMVIADQRMPEITGIELLEKMKQISPEPVRMVLSAYTDIQYLIDAINRGEVYRYITKPWSPEELQITIKNALAHYQAERDREQLSAELAERNKELSVKNRKLEEVLRELKAAQAQLVEMERFSIIGRMSGMIVHDLKQPLDIIRSAAETMTRLDLKEKDRLEIAEMIQDEVERFMTIIQEVLEYSRGTLSLEMEEMLLSDFWGITEQRLINYLRNYDIGIRFLPVDGDAHIRIDHHKMQRVIINLVKNAVEALKNMTGQKTPEIVFRIDMTPEEVIFQISDNGPGIPADVQDSIFKPFVSTKKQYGIGLGLTIVKKIIEEHQGVVEFTTSPDYGTTFYIHIKKATRPAMQPA